MLASKQFTPRHYQSLYALTGHPGWNGFIDMLVTEQTATLQRMMDTVDMTTLRQLQGRAKVIKDLQELAAQAGDILGKLGHTGL